MTRNPSEMTGYASMFPGVDHLPTRLPRIDRYGHAWCWCGVRNGGAVAGDGQCDQCRASCAPGHPCSHPARYGHGSVVWSCAECGQTHAVPLAGDGSQVPPNVCGPCQDRAREPQGDAMRLFEPAPVQITGQQGMML